MLIRAQARSCVAVRRLLAICALLCKESWRSWTSFGSRRIGSSALVTGAAALDHAWIDREGELVFAERQTQLQEIGVEFIPVSGDRGGVFGCAVGRGLFECRGYGLGQADVERFGGCRYPQAETRDAELTRAGLVHLDLQAHALVVTKRFLQGEGGVVRYARLRRDGPAVVSVAFLPIDGGLDVELVLAVIGNRAGQFHFVHGVSLGFAGFHRELAEDEVAAIAGSPKPGSSALGRTSSRIPVIPAILVSALMV